MNELTLPGATDRSALARTPTAAPRRPRIVAAGLIAGSVVAAVWTGAANDENQAAVAERPTVRSSELYALDYRRQLFDFERAGYGKSQQVDEDWREIVGDVHFDGSRLALIETFESSGRILDLGRDVQPDNEFSVFFGLRWVRRRFVTREFPYQDRFVPFNSIDRDLVFSLPDESNRVVALKAGHTYLLRFARRAKVEDGRIYLVRVVGLQPGQRVEFIWRELKHFDA